MQSLHARDSLELLENNAIHRHQRDSWRIAEINHVSCNTAEAPVPGGTLYPTSPFNKNKDTRGCYNRWEGCQLKFRTHPSRLTRTLNVYK